MNQIYANEQARAQGGAILAGSRLEARQPEVQAEHERLMGSLGRLVEMQRQLCDRLAPVRAMRPEPVAPGNSTAAKEVPPATDIGCRIRAADDAVRELICRTEAVLGDLEV